MVTHLGDLLDTARRRHFVGRRRELACFDEALAGRSAHRVLFVHGQGGIGKTTLLQEFRARARAAGRPVVLLDGRDVDPAPAALSAAVGPFDGGVLLIDGYEQLAPVDGWVRGELIPRMRADSVAVLAGREPPAAPWRTDPGWRQLVAVHRLDPFDPVESDELLCEVDPPRRPRLLALGRGHPLTMALLADLADVPGQLSDAPDLISALLESFLDDVPGDAYLTGLATCAIAWLTTEDLLARLVGAQAPAVWRWLTRRPFITAGPRGLFTHDLARDVLDAEFQRRSPERYRAGRRTVYTHAVAGLRAGSDLDRPLHAQQLLYLLRNSPLADAITTLRAQGSATVSPARPDEHDQVCSIVERSQGPVSAGYARAWLREQPEQVSVVRADDRVAGFAVHLLCPSPLDGDDPVVRAVLDHIGPLRPGERVNIARFLSGTGPYTLLAASVSSIIEWLTRPLAWALIVTVDPAYWAPFYDYLGFSRLLEVDVDGRRHTVYGIDWRRMPIEPWFDLMHERGRSGATGPPPAALLRPPPLDRGRFADAVRTALQTLHRPDRLAANPLVGSALAPTPEDLRAVVEAAIADLADEPRGDRLWAVLNRTYLRPAPTQEAAAAVLDLPLSTYRRHLAKAVDHLTDLLWGIETGARPPGHTGPRASAGT